MAGTAKKGAGCSATPKAVARGQVTKKLLSQTTKLTKSPLNASASSPLQVNERISPNSRLVGIDVKNSALPFSSRKTRCKRVTENASSIGDAEAGVSNSKKAKQVADVYSSGNLDDAPFSPVISRPTQKSRGLLKTCAVSNLLKNINNNKVIVQYTTRRQASIYTKNNFNANDKALVSNCFASTENNATENSKHLKCPAVKSPTAIRLITNNIYNNDLLKTNLIVNSLKKGKTGPKSVRKLTPSASTKNNSKSSVCSSTPIGSASSTFSFSDMSYSESPIIRTRKPNPKYADCIMPANFSFMKQIHLNKQEICPNNFGAKSLDVSNNTVRVAPKSSPVRNISTVRLTRKSSRKQPSTSDSSKPSRIAPKVARASLSTPAASVRTKSMAQTKNKKEQITPIGEKKSPGISLNKNTCGGSILPVNYDSENVSPLIAESSANFRASKQKTLSKSTIPLQANTKSQIKIANKLCKAVGEVKSKKQTTKKKPVIDQNKSSLGTDSVSIVTDVSSRPIKLSQCPIKLAVFKSPINSSVSTENVAGSSSVNEERHLRTESIDKSANFVSEVSIVSSLSNESLVPRRSKREELALALREGKLNSTIDARQLKNSHLAFIAPTIVVHKKVKQTTNTKRVTTKNVSTLSQKETILNKSSQGPISNNANSKQLPVWADQKLTANKSHLSNSSNRPRRLSKVLRETAYDFSFASDEDVQCKPKTKKRVRTKVIKKKPKMQSNKPKLLTTDPEFNKEFPAMFGVKSFYPSNANSDSRAACAAQESLESTGVSTHPNSDLEDNCHDDGDAFNDADESVVLDAGMAISEPTNVARMSSNPQLDNVARNCPTRPSDVAAVDGTAGLSQLQSPSNDDNVTTHNNTNNNTIHKVQQFIVPTITVGDINNSIPTPDATRILSKLVGGTSTPLNEPLRGSSVSSLNQGAIPISDLHLNTTVAASDPVTVSEQIAVCFGFDDSEQEGDEDAGTSLNLSPVHRSTTSALNFHQYSTTSILSDAGVGLAEKEAAPTRFISGRFYHGGSFSLSSINHSHGVSKSLRAGQNTLVQKNLPKPVIQKQLQHKSVTESLMQEKQTTNMSSAPKNVKVQSKLTANKRSKKPSSDHGASANFNESRLFDEVESPVHTPAKSSGSQEMPQTENANAEIAPSPEKSFTKVCLCFIVKNTFIMKCISPVKS